MRYEREGGGGRERGGEGEGEKPTFKEFPMVKAMQKASWIANAVEINGHRVLIHSNSIIIQMGHAEHIIPMHPEPVAK